MGCAYSVTGKKKKKMMKNIPEIAVFVPSMRVPFNSDLQTALKGTVTADVVEKLQALRNNIICIADQNNGIYIYIVCSYLHTMLHLSFFKLSQRVSFIILRWVSNYRTAQKSGGILVCSYRINAKRFGYKIQLIKYLVIYVYLILFFKIIYDSYLRFMI